MSLALDKRQRAMLREMGVDYAQGFVIDVPRPLEQVMQQRTSGEVTSLRGRRAMR